MAVVKMANLSLVALKREREEILQFLMRRAELQVDEIEADENSILKIDTASTASLDEKISELDHAIARINEAAPKKKGLFAKRRSADLPQEGEIESAITIAKDIAASDREIARLTSLRAKEEARLEALAPWKDCALALDFSGSKKTRAVFGTLPYDANLTELDSRFEGEDVALEIEPVSADATQKYVIAFIYGADFEKAMELLKADEFSPISLPYRGSAAENIAAIKENVLKLDSGIAALGEKIASYAELRESVEEARDALADERECSDARNRLLLTESCFSLTGWVKEEDAAALGGELEEKFCCAVSVREPTDDETPPIALKNAPLVEPFEVVTEQYSLPAKGMVDPDAIMAPFYFLLFGMMLSDAGYGFVLSVGCLIMYLRFRPEGMSQKMIKMLGLCGISTMFWGVMFGSYFGNAFSTWFGIKPVLYDPINEPMRFLTLAFIIGAVHLLTGLGVSGYMLLKQGKIVDFICDILAWQVMLIGLGFLFFEPLAQIGKYMAICGAAVILVTAGRKEKSIFKKLTGGFGSLYGATGYLSDVLSYSRLLALGLATGVIGTVINTMGEMLPPIGYAIVFVIGHSVNIGINVLGAYVHACRLQYVEFFGKFYEGGGKKFTPFESKTKYVKFK